MATTLKVLGQSTPAATTATTLYTVPGSTSTVVSSLTVCNTNAFPVTFRVAVRPAGAALATQHYVYYDQVLDANTTFILTGGLSLATTDVVTVYASHTLLAFSLFGSEVA